MLPPAGKQHRTRGNQQRRNDDPARRIVKGAGGIATVNRFEREHGDALRAVCAMPQASAAGATSRRVRQSGRCAGRRGRRAVATRARPRRVTGAAPGRAAPASSRSEPAPDSIEAWCPGRGMGGDRQGLRASSVTPNDHVQPQTNSWRRASAHPRSTNANGRVRARVSPKYGGALERSRGRYRRRGSSIERRQTIVYIIVSSMLAALGGHVDGRTYAVRRYAKARESGLRTLRAIVDVVCDIDVHRIPARGAGRSTITTTCAAPKTRANAGCNAESHDVRWIAYGSRIRDRRPCARLAAGRRGARGDAGVAAPQTIAHGGVRLDVGRSEQS